jgi:hypothetical protein
MAQSCKQSNKEFVMSEQTPMSKGNKAYVKEENRMIKAGHRALDAMMHRFPDALVNNKPALHGAGLHE